MKPNLLNVLLLGTRILQRKIMLRRLLLDQEMRLVKANTHQLKETAIARTTSPQTLGLSCATGFAVGMLNRHRTRALPLARFALRHALWPLLFAGAQTLWHRHNADDPHDRT